MLLTRLFWRRGHSTHALSRRAGHRSKSPELCRHDAGARGLDRGAAASATALEVTDFTSSNIPADVLRWLVGNVPRGSKVLELGGGKSTRELLKCFAVTTIDHDPTFVEGVGAALVQAALADGYYEGAKLEEVLREAYDVVIIDGPPAWERSQRKRRLGFQRWLGRLGNRPVIVVDDVNRPWDFVNCALIVARTGRSPLLFRDRHKLCAVIQRKWIRPGDIGWMVGYPLCRIARHLVRRVALLARKWRGEPLATSQDGRRWQ